MITREAYPEWWSALDALQSAKGTFALLGATDTGKTTFCALLASELVNANRPCALIDCDIGQSEIGPPTTLGLALVREPFESLGDLKPRAIHFVGTNSPGRNPMGCVIGAKKLHERAQEEHLDATLIDTSGFVFGGAAQFLKASKLDLIRPDHLIVLERRNELSPLLSLLEKRHDWQIHRVPVPESIGKKPPAFRIQRRRARLMLYFQNSRRHTLKLNDVGLLNSRLGSGVPLAANRLKLVEQTCRAPVLAAEIAHHMLHLVTPRELDGFTIGALQQQFNVEKVFALHPDHFKQLLVGLTDFDGKTYAVGILEKIDFQARALSILAPIRDATPVRWVQLGLMRIAPDGKELGEIRPWQV